MSQATAVRAQAAGAVLDGDVVIPASARGVVLFAHGSGSSRHSPRNRTVAARLNEDGFATVLMDLLTDPEERVDERTAALRFDIPLLAGRLTSMIDWIHGHRDLGALPLGLFGASTGAAAALVSAADRPDRVATVVSRGGRPDLAGGALAAVTTPTLLIVGARDQQVVGLNREAAEALAGPVELRLVPEATHLFAEPGALAQVADWATEWFERRLGAARPVVR